MRIAKIRIRNYRRFKDTEIYFSDKLTVLAGANNSGKTSLVHLFDCILGNKFTLKPKDISLVNQSIITKRLFEMFITSFSSKMPTDLKKLKEQIYDLLFDKSTGKLQIIEDNVIIQLSITYKVGENISLFARYLMDLDDKKKSFHFEITQEVNPYILKNNLETNVDSIQNHLKRYFDAEKKHKLCNPNEPKYQDVSLEFSKARQLLVEKLFKIYGDSLDMTYKYANEDFSLAYKMEKKDFIELFNYSYLSADRQLNDNTEKGKRTLTSSVVDLLNIERKNETSSSEWKNKIEQMLEKMFNAISNKT